MHANVLAPLDPYVLRRNTCAVLTQSFARLRISRAARFAMPGEGVEKELGLGVQFDPDFLDLLRCEDAPKPDPPCDF